MTPPTDEQLTSMLADPHCVTADEVAALVAEIRRLRAAPLSHDAAMRVAEQALQTREWRR